MLLHICFVEKAKVPSRAFDWFDKMSIYSVFIINRAGGLIYDYDRYSPDIQVEKTFSYPLDLTLKVYDEKITVAFGQRDGIKGWFLVSLLTVSCIYYSYTKCLLCL